MMNTSRLVTVLMLFTVGLVAGCASAPSDSALFVLDDGPAPASGAPISGAPTLSVNPVMVADYLNRGGLVFQTAPYKVVIANNNRWAAPLAGQLTDTLYNVLSRRLRQVNVQRGRASGDTAYGLVTRVDAFYGSHDGQAHVAGVWQLVDDQGMPVRRENFDQAIALDQDGYAELVAKLSQAWQNIAADMSPPIAASLARR